MKIHTYIAHSGYCSRRKAEELVTKKIVSVNGVTAHIGQVIQPDTDIVRIGKTIITALPESEHVYFLVNKPIGYVSTTADELGRKSVTDLAREHTQHRVYPVGRLDTDSQGLMLLTNDGRLTHMLSHPKFEIHKTYSVLVVGTPSQKALDHLRRGVKLKEGYTTPAQVSVLYQPAPEGFTWVEITIHEGRNRQIRRMMERVGYSIKKLIRTRLGPFTLSDLGGKRCVPLDAEKVKQMLHIQPQQAG